MRSAHPSLKTLNHSENKIIGLQKSLGNSNDKRESIDSLQIES